MDLYSIGLKHQTDKIIDHGYHRIYTEYIDKYRSMSGALVEIGVEDGRSMRMWREYFPNFHIHGFDKEKAYTEERISVVLCDQSNTDHLTKAYSDVSEPVWVINDDGSHYPRDQILTFSILFDKLLQPGGTYIIEDIETSYWKRGELYGNTFKFGYKHPHSVIEVFKHIVEDVNCRYTSEGDKIYQNKLLSRWISPEARKMIRSITFEQNCIIVRKVDTNDVTYRANPYRHSAFSE